MWGPELKFNYYNLKDILDYEFEKSTVLQSVENKK